MKYKYWCIDDGETADDATAVTHSRFDYVTCKFFDDDEFPSDYHATVAEYAAMERQEGSEWYEGEREFAIVDENGVEKKFAVSIEYTPTFSATEIR